MASVGADLSALPSPSELRLCAAFIILRPWDDAIPAASTRATADPCRACPSSSSAAIAYNRRGEPGGRGKGVSMFGLRELAVVATVVVVLYGRSSVLRSRRFQSIWPWIAPVRRKPAPARTGGSARRDRLEAPPAHPAAAGVVGRPGLFQLDGNRLFWFLTILAATAVASIIVTRSMILQGGGPASHP